MTSHHGRHAMVRTVIDRLAGKTLDQRFRLELETGLQLAPRVAQDILGLVGCSLNSATNCRSGGVAKSCCPTTISSELCKNSPQMWARRARRFQTNFLHYFGYRPLATEVFSLHPPQLAFLGLTCTTVTRSTSSAQRLPSYRCNSVDQPPQLNPDVLEQSCPPP
jgi:hypothetical protein